MGRKLIGFGLFCCLLFVNTVESESANRAPSKKRLSKEEKAKILKDFEEFESQIAGAITSVVKNLHQEDECSDRDKNANGNCPKPTPGPPIDFGEAGESLLKRVEIVEQTVFALLPILPLQDHHKRVTNVPRPDVLAKLNSAVNLSCESSGEPLDFCTWEVNKDGYRGTMVIDNLSERRDRRFAEGISALGSALQEGKCGIEIHSVQEHDMGTWTCTLMVTNGQLYSGKVMVLDHRKDTKIYFVAGLEVKAVSEKTWEVSSIMNATDDVFGVAVDGVRNQIWWSSEGVIYRSEIDGSGMVTSSLDTAEYGSFWGLGLDWVSGTLYAASDSGFILSCNGTQSFRCGTILSGLGQLRGIAVDPYEGIYWTKCCGSIGKAGTRGEDPVTLVSGLQFPMGIVIDFPSSNLYWADHHGMKIQSSDRNGLNVVTVKKLSSQPFGIAVLNGNLYWSLLDKASGLVVQTLSLATGQTSVVRNVTYSEITGVGQLTVAGGFPHMNRTSQ